jgi:RNA polymerase sigma-70 factor (ECF subfamily)
VTAGGHIHHGGIGESTSTSSRLIAGLRDCDGDAWRLMAALYAPLVHRWVVRTGLRQEDAADIVQEVFTVVFRRVASFRKEQPGDSFRGWLRGITQNIVRNHVRRVAGRPQAAGGSEAQRQLQQAPADLSSSGLDDGYGAVCRRALNLIQAEFEHTTWQAFWLVAVEGQSSSAVAEGLGITLNAVYLAKSRVARRLREVLGEAD